MVEDEEEVHLTSYLPLHIAILQGAATEVAAYSHVHAADVFLIAQNLEGGPQIMATGMHL